MFIKTLLKFPSFGVWGNDKLGENEFIIDVDENGEICILLDHFNEYKLKDEKFDLSDILEDSELDINKFNKQLEQINEIYPGLDLPLLEDNFDLNYNSELKIEEEYTCKSLMYFLKQDIRPRFSDYFETIFDHAVRSERCLEAAYYYPISKVINELPNDAHFSIIIDRVLFEYASDSLCKLTSNFDPKNRNNIEFIEKFCGEYTLEQMKLDEKVLLHKAVSLTNKNFNASDVQILIESYDNAHQAKPIWANDNVYGYSEIEIIDSDLVYIESGYIKDVDFFDFINNLKTEFPPNEELRFKMQIKGKFIELSWQMLRLLDKGLLKKKHLSYMNGGIHGTIENNKYNQDIINRIREIKGLPSIDFNKKYYVKDEC